MQLDLNSDRPVYICLTELIQTRIISGYYKPGDKLPSVRDLAAEADVNPNTMQKALAELERTGLIYTKRTIGRFITSDENIILKLKDQSARHLIWNFILKMKQLGFNSKETRKLLTSFLK